MTGFEFRRRRDSRAGPGRQLCRVLLPVHLVVALLLAGCDKPATPVETPIKSVKTMIVEIRGGSSSRSFTGRVAASNTAELSFAVNGTVARIGVNVGDKVRRGQVLATIDPQLLKLEVDGARADLSRAQSALTEHSNTLRRNRELFRQGFIGQAAVEQSEAAVTAAKSDVAFRQSQLTRTRVRLADATMTAPFDGVIGKRFVQPNEEVNAGTKVLSLLGEDQLKIEVSVPEILIARIHLGLPGTVSFGALPGRSFAGKVSEIGRIAGAGNVYPVTISLDQAPDKLRAGMTAEVGLRMPTVQGEQDGYLVPVSALRPGEEPGKGHVFVLKEGVARMVPVSVLSVRDNDAVVSGVEPGSQIIVAGVAFLSDGKRVKPMTP